MKRHDESLKRFLALGGLGVAVALLTACKSGHYADINPKHPFVFPGERPATLAAAPTRTATDAPAPYSTPPAAPARTAPAPVPNLPSSVANPGAGFLRVGDEVIVTFSDLPSNHLQIPEARLRIAEDGKITLQYNVTVMAAGKTARQLEQEIRAEYVPKYFKYLTVSVKNEYRFYFVGGEVKIPARQSWAGEITVLRAIDTAGGFTDFANRKNIELRRATTGEKIKINWHKAIKDPKLDPLVYPNDQITVHKRFW